MRRLARGLSQVRSLPFEILPPNQGAHPGTEHPSPAPLTRLLR